MTTFPRPCIIRRTLPKPRRLSWGEKLRPTKAPSIDATESRNHAPPLNSKLRAKRRSRHLGSNPAYHRPRARDRKKKCDRPCAAWSPGLGAQIEADMQSLSRSGVPARRSHHQIARLLFIGKTMISRMFGVSASNMTIRSMPGANPPCGGAPNGRR